MPAPVLRLLALALMLALAAAPALGATEPGPGASLAGAALRGADLAGRDLSGATLRGADLRGADLRRARLVRADLRGADLRRADLRGARLRGAKLLAADLSGADLSGANLTRAHLERGLLANARMRRVVLRGGVLRGASLNGARLPGVDLSGLDLAGADFSRARMFGASLAGANLRGAGLLGADLRRVELTGAHKDRRTAIPASPRPARVARAAPSPALDATAPWKFVVMPDFLNQDIDYPDPDWDPTLDFVLKRVAAERPDFVAVPGDVVMGHWTALGPAGIQAQGSRYYAAWLSRMRAHGLTTYVSPGDHDVGDNPWGPAKRALVDTYERTFATHMGMPRNGPPAQEGLAFSVRHKNLLLVGTNPFEQYRPGGPVAIGVTGEQLAWMETQLAADDAAHSVVMGHVPILPATHRRNTSALAIPGGGGSRQWEALVRGGASLYLAGEYHDFSAARKDGVTQVVSGALPGVTDEVTYLVVTVHPDRLELALKSIPTRVTVTGPAPGPRELPPVRLALSEDTMRHGPRTLGTMTLDRAGAPSERRGLFARRTRALR